MSPWKVGSILSDKLDISTRVATNLVRLLVHEENTPTFIARYRNSHTENMKPEDVFAAYKLIKELNEVQKKALSLKKKLESSGKLTPVLRKARFEFNNETINDF